MTLGYLAVPPAALKMFFVPCELDPGPRTHTSSPLVGSMVSTRARPCCAPNAMAMAFEAVRVTPAHTLTWYVRLGLPVGKGSAVGIKTLFKLARKRQSSSDSSESKAGKTETEA